MTVLDANFLNYNSNSFEVINNQLHIKCNPISGLIITSTGLSLSLGSGLLIDDDLLSLNVLNEDWNIGSTYRITGILDPIEDLDVANKQFIVNSIAAVEHPDIGTETGQILYWDGLKYKPILDYDFHYDELNHRIGLYTNKPKGIIDIRGLLTNIAMSGTASASSEQDSSHNADKAFDGNDGTLWGNNNVMPVTLQYDFGSGNSKIINTYTLKFNNKIIDWDDYDFSPNDWLFKGSIDGSEWHIIDTRNNEGWDHDEEKFFTCNNTTSYRFYAIEITNNKGTSNDFVGIVELQLYDSNSIGMIISENGNAGFGIDEPSRKIEIVDFKQSQLRLTYEFAVNYTDLFTNIDGDFEINPYLGNIKLLKDLKTDRWIESETNTYIGMNVIGNNTLSHISGNDGYFNTICGTNAGYSITTGYSNIILGYNASYNITSGFQNILIGNENSYNLLSGYNNIAIGSYSSFENIDGYHNITLGIYSGFSNTIGNNNINIGSDSNYFNEEGSNNTIIGYQSGRGTSVHNKYGNVFIGYKAGYNELSSNKLYIANTDTASPLIGGDFDSSQLYINDTVGINTNEPRRNLDIFNNLNPQIRLTHTTDTNFVDLQSDSFGNLILNPSNGFVGLDTVPETTIDIVGTAFLLPIPDVQLADSHFKTSQISTYIDGGILHFKVKDGLNVLHDFRYKTIEELSFSSIHLTSNAWGELDSNYNFPGWTYITTDRVAHDGCFEITSNSPGSTEYITTEYIPINPFKKYSFSGWFKSVGLASNGFIYAGFISYDKDKNRIGQENYLHNLNTETTLSINLNDGDTIVYLTSVSNWDNSSSNENRYIAVFDDSYYSNLGTYYYTKKVALYDEGSVDESAKTITLSSPWVHGTISAGTPIANTRIQNNYDYDVIPAEQIPNTWEFRSSGIVTGISESTEDNNAKFKPGTAFIRQTVLETNQENIYKVRMDGFETKVEINEFIDKNYPQLSLINTLGIYYTDLITDSHGYLKLLPSNERVGINTQYPPNIAMEIFDENVDQQLRLTRIMDSSYVDLGSTVDGDLIINSSNGNILTSNSLGIGITTLNRKFDVVDTINPQIRISYLENLNFAEFQADNNGFLNIITSGGIIKTLSKIGIGIEPTRNFEIFDAANPQLKLTQTNSTNFVEFQVDSDSNLNITPNLGLVSILSQLNIFKTSGNQLELIQLVGTNFANFKVDNTGKLYINASGNNIIIENKLNIEDSSNSQLELIQTNGVNYIDLQANDSGNLIINTSGGNIETSSKIKSIHTLNAQLQLAYAVDTIFTELQTDATGDFNINTSGGNIYTSSKLNLVNITNSQLRLTQDGDNFVDYQVDNSGDLNIIVNNGIINIDSANLTTLVSTSLTSTTLISTTLQLGSTVEISSIFDEDDFASNSTTALATQQSIKTYVDESIFWSRSGSTIEPKIENDYLDIGFGILKSGSIGVNIDNLPVRQVEIFDNSNPQLRLTQTDAEHFAEFQVDSNGNLYLRTSNNAVLPYITNDNFGSNVARWTIFANDIFSNKIQLGSTVEISSIFDEDDFASNSTTALATQQSIKTYVDNAIGVENLWNRTGTTLSPNISNDNIDIGSGILNIGQLGVNITSTPTRKVEILDNTNSQLRLTHTLNTNFTDLKVNADGSLIFISSNNTLLPNTTEDNFGSVSLRWNIFAHDIQIDGNITHTGANIGFFGTTPTTQQSALTPTDASTVDDTYGTEERDVIQNLVTRVAELEAVLQAYGLL